MNNLFRNVSMVFNSAVNTKVNNVYFGKARASDINYSKEVHGTIDATGPILQSAI